MSHAPYTWVAGANPAITKLNALETDLAALGDGGNGLLEGSLASQANAGASTLTAAVTAPALLQGASTILLIEPGSENMEIRAAERVSSATITLDRTLTKTHSAGARIIAWFSEEVPSYMFGALADGSTNDEPALQAGIRETQAAGVALVGNKKRHMISAPLVGSSGTDLRRFDIRALADFSPIDTAMGAMLISAQNSPIDFTATAADNTFTTATAHGAHAGNRIVLKGSSLPGGAVSGRIYWVESTPTTTTFTVTETDGGAALDLTTDGSGTAYGDTLGLERLFLEDVYLNGAAAPGVNGIINAPQQPQIWRRVRVDDCTGTGVIIDSGQDAEFDNLELIGNGTGIELGRSFSASMLKFSGNFNVEGSVTRAVEFTNAFDILLEGFHGEGNPNTFHVPAGGNHANITYVNPHISYSADANPGWHFEGGGGNGNFYQIIGHKPYGGVADSTVIINDVSRSDTLTAGDLPNKAYAYEIGVFIQNPGPNFGTLIDSTPSFYSARSSTPGLGSVPANSAVTFTVTVTGAATGQVVIATPELNPGAAFVWSARVSAADTVEVRVANITAAAATPTDGNWQVRAIS